MLKGFPSPQISASQTDNQLNRINFNLLVTDYYLCIIIREMRPFWFLLFVLVIMTNLVVEARLTPKVKCPKGYFKTRRGCVHVYWKNCFRDTTNETNSIWRCCVVVSPSFQMTDVQSKTDEGVGKVCSVLVRDRRWTLRMIAHEVIMKNINTDLFVEKITISMSTTWTQVEKEHLLETLQRHGVNSIEKIAEVIPSKSIFDIRSIISKYQTMAQRSLVEKSSTSTTSTSEAPIDMWIELMRQILTKDNHNILSRVLKYIALFERRTEGSVNLQDCYTVLSDLTNGNPSKQLEGKTADFFFECLTRLAKSAKESNNAKEIAFLNDLESHKLTVTKTYRSKNDKNSAVSDANFNPCKVPLNLLMESEKN
ncbi:hypothetical protein Trydic_g15115 [Trypoxylus dichotomus]